MYYYFYKITNNINGKYYYGVHSTENINDGYMGSGVYLNNAYNKYGQSNFTKTIMRYFVGKEDMYEYEKQIVNEDCIKDPMCYNIAIGGLGGDRFTYLPKDEYDRIIEILKKRIPWNKGKKGVQSGEKNPFYNKHHTEETKQSIGRKNKGKTPWNKGKKGVQAAWNKGKKGVQTAWNKGLTKETDERVAKYSQSISESTKGRTPWNKNIDTIK